MPFQSEKQRRYLWANEPEIAREWTDRYGANQGGITRLPFALGDDPYNDRRIGAEMIGIGTPLANQSTDNLVAEKWKAPGPRPLDPFQQLTNMGYGDQIENMTDEEVNQMYDSVMGHFTQNPYEDIEGHTARKVPGLTMSDASYNIENPNEEFQAYEKFNPTVDEEGIARLIAQAEEEKINYPVEEQISPFKQWSRDFWDQPGKNLWRGANIALNPLNKDNPINMGVGLLAQNIDFPDLRGGQTQGAYNKARQERILAKRIRQRKSDKTQANMERWRDEERKRKFEEETKRMQEQLWQQQAQQVQQNIQTYGNRDRPNTGMNRPGGGRGQSPTGGDVSGTPFAHGGLAGLWHKR